MYRWQKRWYIFISFIYFMRDLILQEREWEEGKKG